MPTRPPFLSDLSLVKSSTVEQIARALEERILKGEIAPGSVLRESVLARATGVSRNSVREAIRGLVPGGLVRHIPDRGFFVARISADEIRNIYGAREIVEIAALRARFAIISDSVGVLEKTVRSLGKCIRGRDWNGVFHADRAFHIGIVGALGNPYLDHLVSGLFDALRLALVQIDRTRPDTRTIVDEHQGIVQAIRRRDRSVSLKRLRDHLRQAAINVADHMKSQSVD